MRYLFRKPGKVWPDDPVAGGYQHPEYLVENQEPAFLPATCFLLCSPDFVWDQPFRGEAEDWPISSHKGPGGAGGRSPPPHRHSQIAIATARSNHGSSRTRLQALSNSLQHASI